MTTERLSARAAASIALAWSAMGIAAGAIVAGWLLGRDVLTVPTVIVVAALFVISGRLRRARPRRVERRAEEERVAG